MKLSLLLLSLPLFSLAAPNPDPAALGNRSAPDQSETQPVGAEGESLGADGDVGILLAFAKTLKNYAAQNERYSNSMDTLTDILTNHKGRETDLLHLRSLTEVFSDLQRQYKQIGNDL